MMMGEDGESEDENAFNNKPLLARILVIAAVLCLTLFWHLFFNCIDSFYGL